MESYPTKPLAVCGSARLPGGVMVAGERRRSFAFRPLTGALEMLIAETAIQHVPVAAHVTRILQAALAEVGTLESTAATVEALCVADRQFLLRLLMVEFGHNESWLTATCGACSARFDARLVISELPVHEAIDYPETRVQTSQGWLRLRVPTGADQVAVARLAPEEALPELTQRLILGIEEREGAELKSIHAAPLSPTDLEAIDRRLEEVFPFVPFRVQAPCPECRQPNQLDAAPLPLLRQVAALVMGEVDLLARQYHWSEADILNLPRLRRHGYVRLLDRARGFAE